MDKDVEGRLNRLCEKYLTAGAMIQNALPPQLPSGRGQRRLEAGIVDVLGRLQEARKPLVAALVRLAYVKGLRSVQEDARLDEDRTSEVEDLEAHTDKALGREEACALFAFHDYLRRMKAVKALEDMNTNPRVVEALRRPASIYPLEQHVRAKLHSLLEVAATAGALAATQAGEYDGEL